MFCKLAILAAAAALVVASAKKEQKSLRAEARVSVVDAADCSKITAANKDIYFSVATVQSGSHVSNMATCEFVIVVAAAFCVPNARR